MTDNELKRLLQEKFKFHELNLPVNGWDAIEKRLPVAPRRMSMLWRWSVSASIAAIALIGIILFNSPSNSLPASSNLVESKEVKTLLTNDSIEVSNHLTNSGLPLLAKTDKQTKSNKDIKKTDKKTTDKSLKKQTKSKDKTANEEDDSNSVKDTETIETTPKEEQNQEPSWHEQEDDGAEYIVQIETVKKHTNINQTIENQNFASKSTPKLSIEEAEQLMKEQDKQQLTSIQESKENSILISDPNLLSLGLLASLTPNIITLNDVFPTVLMDNTFSYRSMTHTNSKHDLPIMIGASIGIPLNKHLQLQTGINYTYIHSTITQANLITGDYSEDNQKLHYLGIPIMLSYLIFDYKIMQLYVSGGGMGEKGLIKDVSTQNFDDEQNLLSTDSEQFSINGLQWSLTTNVGLGITIYKGLHLFFEPGFTWNIPNTQSPQPESIRTEHPYNLSLTAGLRYNLNKKR